ncbi:MAG: M20/M25/M40 family metallo-hydrolase, partial [Actinobacteria bacterium]|nr:M20/M25/M40 family metallo-hydrolase [Actinomycetota bacterium]
MDERGLAERLITYDTSTLDGIKAAAGFVKGWLESNEIPVVDGTAGGLPVIAATVGAPSGPTIVLHGHLDVVPGRPGQFEPRVEGDRLIGRGAYDMKGGLAAMMCAVAELASQEAVRVHFVCVADEESDESQDRGSDYVVSKGYVGDFAI